MSRQHSAPILIPADGASASALKPISLTGSQTSEAFVQELVQSHPMCLPIIEIDPLFANPVSICTELNTRAGPIDNLLVTATGLPVLVECKLWRNPEQRREVIGQILDYAKELARWSSSDLQREVARRLKREGSPILDLVRQAGHDIEEATFNDALTLNLRRGRFLLLIVGDGIREGVEAIAEYLQTHAGLHFTFGLVEMPLHLLPNGTVLATPRVLARTTLITREVITVPAGMTVHDGTDTSGALDEVVDNATLSRVAFLRDLVSVPLALDPDQPTPRVTEKGWLSLYLPAPASSCWISILLKDGRRQIGIRLTSNAGTVGEAAIGIVARDWADLKAQLGGNASLREISPGRFVIEEFFTVDRHGSPERRDEALRWLRERMRDFVAVFRPRIRDAVAALKD